MTRLKGGKFEKKLVMCRGWVYCYAPLLFGSSLPLARPLAFSKDVQQCMHVSVFCHRLKPCNLTKLTQTFNINSEPEHLNYILLKDDDKAEELIVKYESLYGSLQKNTEKKCLFFYQTISFFFSCIFVLL